MQGGAELEAGGGHLPPPQGPPQLGDLQKHCYYWEGSTGATGRAGTPWQEVNGDTCTIRIPSPNLICHGMGASAGAWAGLDCSLSPVVALGFGTGAG